MNKAGSTPVCVKQEFYTLAKIENEPTLKEARGLNELIQEVDMRPGYRKRTIAGDKTICLPFPEGAEYEALLEDAEASRQYLDRHIREHPELFPSDIEQGYQYQ